MNKYVILSMCFFTALFANSNMNGQSEIDDLPYYEIPDYPEEFTATTVAARLLDGLGFRYYWATEGLTEKDLSYKPSESGRTIMETMEHLHGLTRVVNNAVNKKPNIRSVNQEKLTYDELRSKTLYFIKDAADILRTAESSEMEEYKVIFQRGENISEFPFWNNINGPIADALWHCGQVVMMRRAAGNPFNSKASVFSGKVRS